MQLKDETLDAIAQRGGNVAQFVSYGPDGQQRFLRIRSVDPSFVFSSIEEAADAILRTGAPFVNIRSFLPKKPDGNPFFFGRKGFETPVKVAQCVRELLAQGYYVIINEDIDIADGGFSGVRFGNVVEFASRDTPRCVEKPGCAQIPAFLLPDLVRIVYGRFVDTRNPFLNIPYSRSQRVEFSVHPGPVGYFRQNQIIWQVEKQTGQPQKDPIPSWPNRYSQDMGDKAYGLLVAHLYGFRIPRTEVIGRIIAPFEFGIEAGNGQLAWVRTCPREQQPGLYTTKHGWLDAFALMQREDPDGTKISSIIIQSAVDAAFAGAALTDASGQLLVEGKAGFGDAFMIGESGPDRALPEHVLDDVTGLWEKMCAEFGPVRFEWSYDKRGTLWVMQLHVGQSASSGDTIFPGNPADWNVFRVERGLDSLRRLIKKAKREKFGIVLKGNVGVTSHFGDLLRRNEVPSRLERE